MKTRHHLQLYSKTDPRKLRYTLEETLSQAMDMLLPTPEDGLGKKKALR